MQVNAKVRQTLKHCEDSIFVLLEIVLLDLLHGIHEDLDDFPIFCGFGDIECGKELWERAEFGATIEVCKYFHSVNISQSDCKN